MVVSGTREPQIQGLSVNSIADSLNLNLFVYFAVMPSYFSMIQNRNRQINNTIKSKQISFESLAHEIVFRHEK